MLQLMDLGVECTRGCGQPSIRLIETKQGPLARHKGALRSRLHLIKIN